MYPENMILNIKLMNYVRWNELIILEVFIYGVNIALNMLKLYFSGYIYFITGKKETPSETQ